jgi:hypothetical protein
MTFDSEMTLACASYRDVLVSLLAMVDIASKPSSLVVVPPAPTRPALEGQPLFLAPSLERRR